MLGVSDNFWSAFCVFHAHFWGKTHSFKICALKKRNNFRQLKKHKLMLNKTCTDDIDYNEVISEWRSAKQRRIYQSSWITWSIRLWLLWGIVLWKESLCKTWIVFILIKCICFIIKKKSCVKSCKNVAFLKNPLFSKRPIVFQHAHFFIPLFWNEKLSLLGVFYH